MFEILMYLFESYFDTDDYPELDTLSRKLSAVGFAGNDISDALAWLSTLQQQNMEQYPATLAHRGIRHFAEFETVFLSLEARQFILFAEQNGMIDASQREMIIDRAIALQQENLAADKLKLIMLMVLWNGNKELDPLLVDELLSPLNTAFLH